MHALHAPCHTPVATRTRDTARNGVDDGYGYEAVAWAFTSPLLSLIGRLRPWTDCHLVPFHSYHYHNRALSERQALAARGDWHGPDAARLVDNSQRKDPHVD